MCCDHWNIAEGVVNTTALGLDVLIAKGLAVRHWDEAVGQYRYFDPAMLPNSDSVAKVN